jgi:hypothetical protein
MRTAAMKSISLCTRMTKLTAFFELESACAKLKLKVSKNEPDQPQSALRTLSLVVPTIYKFRA